MCTYNILKWHVQNTEKSILFKQNEPNDDVCRDAKRKITQTPANINKYQIERFFRCFNSVGLNEFIMMLYYYFNHTN